MQKIKIRIVSFDIPNSPVFPDEYRDGSMEVAVWPSPGAMLHVLDREGGLERLESWAKDGILLGLIKGYFDEEELRQDGTFIKVLSREGKVLVDTFVWDDRWTFV
jgi:hypothetical protein